MRLLARKERLKWGFDSPRVMVSDLRRVYKQYGIAIDYWPHKLRNVRGAFFDDHLGPSVIVAKALPRDPKAFTLAHELKHFLVDRGSTIALCHGDNEGTRVEIGAEVFAAEYLFPERDFVEILEGSGIRRETLAPEDLVHLKRKTDTTLSYTGLAKRAEFLGYCPKGALVNVKWKKLEERLYGEPLYKTFLKRAAKGERANQESRATRAS